MIRIGEYECTNHRCAMHHQLVDRKITEGRRQKCHTCRHPLRLYRVRQAMDNATRKHLRALSAAQKGA